MVRKPQSNPLPILHTATGVTVVSVGVVRLLISGLLVSGSVTGG